MENTHAANLSCVYNTIHFIEHNFSEPITAQDLEKVSHYSYRNIQRIFKYTCGITIGAYQKKLKLENAYKSILYTSENITSIAYQVGFSNLAAFSKAFKQQFGISPSEARSNKHLLLADNTLTPVEADLLLEPAIVYLPALTVYYESAFIPYINDKIEAAWDRFMQYEFPTLGTDYYGLVVDDPIITEEINCRYDVCSSLPDRQQSLPAKTILGGRYAEFLHHGSYATIEDTYTKIYSRWIVETDQELDHTPVVERYIKNADNTPAEEEYLTSILLPLK